MKDCFKRFLLPSLALLLFASAFFGSCTDVDNQLGMGLLPDDQDMILKEATVTGVRSYMAVSDSLPVSQLNLMVLGNYTSDFGHIRSGAALQFVPSGFTDSEGFNGYRPHADSIFLYLQVSEVYGDNTKPQKFYIYKINKTLPTIRETVYDEFDASQYADMANPLFSFDMQDEGTGTVVKKLTEEAGGNAFLQELVNFGIDDDYEIYNNQYLDSLYKKSFLGFYIAPSTDPAEAAPDGALYLMSPLSGYDSYYYLSDYTYFTVWLHSHYESADEVEEDKPVLGNDGYYVKDTLITSYSFDDSYISYPNTNIMVLKRDYTSAVFDYPGDLVDDPDEFDPDATPSMETFYVQGLHGVAGYLDFGGDFLKQLKALTIQGGEERILSINKAKLYINLDDPDYRDADGKYVNMDNAPSRLGMYESYKGYLPVNIPDYYYYIEQNNDVTAPYGGYLNRARGFYEMDIQMYLRDLLSDEENTPKRIWLAPGHTPAVFYSPAQVALKNPPGSEAIRLELTYTLLKKTIKE